MPWASALTGSWCPQATISVLGSHPSLLGAPMTWCAVEHDLAEGLQRSQGLLDPLAHWFEVHYSLLARSGRLWPNCRNSTGNLESGKLPTGDAKC
jgi:hypothetical protein